MKLKLLSLFDGNHMKEGLMKNGCRFYLTPKSGEIDGRRIGILDVEI